MARTSVTEESLGLSPTEDELASIEAPADDDVPLDNEDNEPALAPAKPGAETKAKDDPEPEPEPAKEPVKAAEEPKLVDVRAVQEARAETRATKQQMAILEARVNDILAARNAPAQPEKPAEAIPDPETDPMGALRWAKEQIAALAEARTKETAERTAQQQQQAAWKETVDKVSAEYETAVAADPTIPEAYNKLRESQGKEFLAMGLTIPQAKAELDKMEQQHIAYAASKNIPIGDYIKNLALARGWQPGAVAAAAPAAPAKTDIAAVAAAQQRHQSLSDAPGGEIVAPLDAKALANMTDKQFKAWMGKKGNEEKLDEILGA
jgi:hypothetical protein